MSLSTRNKVHVRWTTNPELVGYHTSNEQFKEAMEQFLRRPAVFTGTPRQVLDYYRRMREQLGGVLQRWHFTAASDGREIQLAHLQAAVEVY